jgi:hypothetical protein
MDIKCKSESVSNMWKSKVECDTREHEAVDQEETALKSPHEDKQTPNPQGAVASQIVPATPEAVIGTKRKSEMYLAQSKMGNPRYVHA